MKPSPYAPTAITNNIAWRFTPAEGPSSIDGQSSQDCDLRSPNHESFRECRRTRSPNRWKHVYRRDPVGFHTCDGFFSAPCILVFCNRGLADIDLELEQLAVKP